jgi:prepilin-type N-terminal cleavage/methylation domain-containing protein
MSLRSVHPVRHASGFTLIEALIVMALIAIIVALAGPPFADYLKMQRLRGIAGELATDLAYARSEAVSRRNYTQVRVQSNSAMSCYIIAVRTTPVTTSMCDCTLAPGARCTDPDTTEVKTIQVPVSMQVSLSTPPPPTASVAAPALTINPRTGGVYFGALQENWDRIQFIVESSLDSTRRIRTIMEAGGRIKTCVPAGSIVSGIPTC